MSHLSTPDIACCCCWRCLIKVCRKTSFSSRSRFSFVAVDWNSESRGAGNRANTRAKKLCSESNNVSWKKIVKIVYLLLHNVSKCHNSFRTLKEPHFRCDSVSFQLKIVNFFPFKTCQVFEALAKVAERQGLPAVLLFLLKMFFFFFCFCCVVIIVPATVARSVLEMKGVFPDSEEKATQTSPSILSLPRNKQGTFPTHQY